MREIRTLRSMSGKRKRSAGFDTKPKSPRLFSTYMRTRLSRSISVVFSELDSFYLRT